MHLVLHFLRRPDCKEVFEISKERREEAIRKGGSRFTSYPFSVGLVNMTRFIASLFCLISDDGMAGKKVDLEGQAARGEFFLLLRGGIEDFYDIVADAMVILDSEWRRQQASYMDFPRVFREVKEAVKQFLRDKVNAIES